ncbi:exodeoxyribonuclease VII large subunit [Botrimarina hoheduenensis]|uniref:Exodeoxyribonuclease 7 large subunit n=1 Tax=Botrimarina hoheduenensis TaxID=2528000 RepID=A0A5C5VTX8_9BACT|nr:exodeoxyribonuclease VII large subunit [Botrimarina hoheduenensis]TWT41593.1 Exodeoxyribonuclease 7 large subunit [Botrimarina hoheduenensis]
MPTEPFPVDKTTPAEPQALSVGQLTAQIKGTLEETFPSVWVTGEVSNFSRPQSGHCYLTLKDDVAQIRAVIWRGSASRMAFELRDGVELICHGHLDLYGPRGTYQLVIDRAMPRGVGALEQALRELKARLAKEGLFDAAKKRPLPRFPRRVGFVTSPTGAAVRDFLQVLGRRSSGVEVLVIPTRVQGEGAAEEIAAAIRAANRVRPALDTLVVGRGGGSLEDLWAFNEEPVVRAIANSRIPTISAVGHEIDVTLADLAADLRALTPSEAAERIAPSSAELSSRIGSLRDRLHRSVWRRTQASRQRLTGLAARRPLARPFVLLEDRQRLLDELERMAGERISRKLGDRQALLARIAGQLDSLSPLGVLARGYSLTTHGESSGHGESPSKIGSVVRSADRLAPGDLIHTRLAVGRVASIVKSIHSDP